MTSTYEHIVLGVGGIGAAAAYWLARRGGVSDLLRLSIGLEDCDELIADLVQALQATARRTWRPMRRHVSPGTSA